MTGADVKDLPERLARADRVVAFTGAGMSAESGVPTFRGSDGIWKKFKPEELASMSGFLRNPALVWEWYAHRRRILGEVQPNAAHHALVRLETFCRSVTVITQNIDGLHQRAGSTGVVELHGTIERNYCLTCGTAYGNDLALTDTGIPACRCGGLVRPDVVWFGEMLPEEEWNRAVAASESADVFLSVGTSGVVYPAASLPAVARRAGAFLVDINPEPSMLSSTADLFLMGRAGDILPDLVRRLEQSRGNVPR